MRTKTLTIEYTPRIVWTDDQAIEVEQLSIRLPFARKAETLNDMCASGNEIVYVTESMEMTAAAFDDFAANLLVSRPWLKGKGGSTRGGHLCIEIHAPGRPTLYVDPSGGEYARYVARLG